MAKQQPVTNLDEIVQEFQQQDLVNTEPAANPEPTAADSADIEPEDTQPSVTGEGVCELDRTKDYGQVWGMPGVAFEQDHKYFNFDGFEVKPELEA